MVLLLSIPRISLRMSVLKSIRPAILPRRLTMLPLRRILLTGGISNLPGYYHELLRSLIEKEGGPFFSNVEITVSDYKEKGTLQGTGVLALDRFFFQRNLLVSLGLDPLEA